MPLPLAYFQVQTPSTLPLFGDPCENPQSERFDDAFCDWLSDQRGMGSLRRPGASDVYRAMWDSFASWCLAQSPCVTLDDLTLGDLHAFHTARFGRKSADLSLSPRYALRLMRLIDRVLSHHAASHDVPPNTAAADWILANPDVRFADAARQDPLPEYLTVADARQLIAFLSLARPRPGRSQNAMPSMAWQEVRNRTSVALQLGGGLTPGDVRALTLDSPVFQGARVQARPWKLRVPGNGTSKPRETPIAPWAGELLQHWLQVREAGRIAGNFLFPSTRTGKPWLQDSQYACARRVLEEAGIQSRDGGSFRLRHTFALRQLRRGTTPEQVAHWMGVEPEEMKRYEHVVPAEVDVI